MVDIPATSLIQRTDDDKEAGLGMRLLEDPELRQVCAMLELGCASKAKAQLGFNAFTLLSDTYYRENFHSDVLAAFFDLQGTHGEQHLFLHQFIKLLRSEEHTSELQSL